MGLALAKSGDPAKALPFFQRVVDLRAECPSAGPYLNLGNALFALNQVSKAEDCFRKATVSEPDAHHAWGNLGLVLKRQGKRKQAIVAFQQAHQLAPDVIAYRLNCGNALADLGHFQHAFKVLSALCEDQPECALALVALGRVLLGSGQGWEALVFLKKACELEPKKAQFRLNYAAALAITGHVDEPLAHFREAVRLKPDYWAAWVELGNLLGETGQLSAAQQCFENVLKSQSTHQGALSGLAGLYNRSGRYEEALDLLQSYVGLEANCQVNTAVAIANASNGLHRSQQAIPVLEKALSLTHTKPEQALLWHALGRSLDQTERFDEAFSAYAQSNALRNLSFDPVRHVQETSQTLAAWSQSTLAQQPSSGIDSETPVFVVGMPRSGTSLVEQILSSHSSVYGAGELEFIRQVAGQLGTHGSVLKGLGQCQSGALTTIAQTHLTKLKELSPTALRITDKMPGNFLYLGLIQQLYPKAKIVHCQRAMLDTCISCFRQNFTASYAYTTRLDWLAEYYRQYERLMAHWKSVLNLDIYEVNYETLVQDSENEIRRLVDFCGLEMESACLAPHLNSRVVVTASQAQVREPIHTRSIGSAMRYRFHLGPLLGVKKAA
jgi:tetratricopeptide (TPR) repeat protein